MVGPVREATGNNIYCRFWANLQGGWIKAGVITNIHDTSTFIPLVTVSGSGWNGYEFTTTEVGIDNVYGSHITLFPNPASATVTLTGIEGQATVSVVDMNGRVSGEWRMESGKLTIDVSGFAQGAYFVRITGEQNTAIRKLIVK